MNRSPVNQRVHCNRRGSILQYGQLFIEPRTHLFELWNLPTKKACNHKGNMQTPQGNTQARIWFRPKLRFKSISDFMYWRIALLSYQTPRRRPGFMWQWTVLSFMSTIGLTFMPTYKRRSAWSRHLADSRKMMTMKGREKNRPWNGETFFDSTYYLVHFYFEVCVEFCVVLRCLLFWDNFFLKLIYFVQSFWHLFVLKWYFFHPSVFINNYNLSCRAEQFLVLWSQSWFQTTQSRSLHLHLFIFYFLQNL